VLTEGKDAVVSDVHDRIACASLDAMQDETVESSALVLCSAQKRSHYCKQRLIREARWLIDGRPSPMKVVGHLCTSLLLQAVG
jgi:hypothetical protein